jgi:hypothetical protein
MRLNRIALLCVALGGMAACKNQDVSVTTPPALVAVRFINAVPDTGAVDIRMIDQVEWSAFGTAINFRGGTAYQPTEAKARRIRVFPTSLNIAITSQILLDTTVSLTAGGRVSLVLTGSARSKTLKFVTVDDDISAPAAGQIAVRLVNVSGAPVNGYLVNDTTSALPGSPTYTNVAPVGTSTYVARSIGTAAVRATDAGSATVNASTFGPNAPTSPPGDAFPAAGVNSQYTRFSVYYFPRGVAGSPQNAVTKPTLIWFVDRNPCDPGVTC